MTGRMTDEDDMTRGWGCVSERGTRQRAGGGGDQHYLCSDVRGDSEAAECPGITRTLGLLSLVAMVDCCRSAAVGRLVATRPAILPANC